jgi:hypothetical protein
MKPVGRRREGGGGSLASGAAECGRIVFRVLRGESRNREKVDRNDKTHSTVRGPP